VVRRLSVAGWGGAPAVGGRVGWCAGHRWPADRPAVATWWRRGAQPATDGRWTTPRCGAPGAGDLERGRLRPMSRPCRGRGNSTVPHPTQPPASFEQPLQPQPIERRC